MKVRGQSQIVSFEHDSTLCSNEEAVFAQDQPSQHPTCSGTATVVVAACTRSERAQTRQNLSEEVVTNSHL